jgi:hypothetical protein
MTLTQDIMMNIAGREADMRMIQGTNTLMSMHSVTRAKPRLETADGTMTATILETMENEKENGSVGEIENATTENATGGGLHLHGARVRAGQGVVHLLSVTRIRQNRILHLLDYWPQKPTRLKPLMVTVPF